jgi:hypothetical protein
MWGSGAAPAQIQLEAVAAGQKRGVNGVNGDGPRQEFCVEGDRAV